MRSKKSLPKEDWPEEKILRNGVDALSNMELLAMFIGSGIRGANAKTIARTILDQHGSRLLTLSAAELMRFRGIGRIKAAKLSSRRWSVDDEPPSMLPMSAVTIYRYGH